MPLLRKQPFQRQPPPKNLRPDEDVFVCEATKEVFKDYEDFFQRTILCNSLVWSCAITGKTNLTYEEALESERKAKRRLGNIPKPLKRGLLWVAHHAQRPRITELVDDVYVFAQNRYFKGELVEAIVNEQWCDCRVVRVISPSDEEIAKDMEETEKSQSPSKKNKKSFFPPDHLFKYEVEEIEPEDEDMVELKVVEAEDVRRERGVYTKEKNLLFLKNATEICAESNRMKIKDTIEKKYSVSEIEFADVFAGPEPKFESKKLTEAASTSALLAQKKKGRNSKGGQATLDAWMKGEKGEKPKINKKMSPEEVEAEMKRIREQNQKFKEELRQRAEEAKKRKMEEKAKEKERKKEEAKLLKELMTEWKKPRDDLECDDLKALPRPQPVHCRIPNRLFGDFLTLIEFLHSFEGVLETKDSFPDGVTFEILEQALTDDEGMSQTLYDVLSFMLGALFDLQQEEDEEVRLDRQAPIITDDIDKNILGKDEDIANQIRSATEMGQWSKRTQGQSLRELHMDQWSITEILRLHLEAAGGFRGENLTLWRYQQRGGYRLNDDPGMQFRMEEPQILEALTTKTVFELSISEKIKIMTCLMLQILSFATVRDEVDERMNNMIEAKFELREHKIQENKIQKEIDEAEKQKRREERLHKKEEAEKAKETKSTVKEEPKPAEDTAGDSASEAHLTDRQREAIQSQKDKEEKAKLKKEELRKAEANEKERGLIERICEMQRKLGLQLLGRDRAYRRFWSMEALPGVYVEHDDEFVGECLPLPTPFNPNAGPMDESVALEKVKEILDAREKQSDEKASSDKENDDHKVPDPSKTYSKNKTPSALKQKVLSAKNGSLQSTSGDVKPMTEVNVKQEETERHPLSFGVCISDPMNCTVHSAILPRTYWAYYSTVDEVEELITGLNDRGFRERDLKEKLIQERDRLSKSLKKFNYVMRDNLNRETEDTKMDTRESLTSVSGIVDLTLRDQILELEEKIFFGTLGSLKIRDRSLWQKAIQDGKYDRQCESLQWGGRTSAETPFESRLASTARSRDASRGATPERDENKRESTGSGSGGASLRRIRDLSCAILQIGQMVDAKYLKPPLGEDPKDKKKRLKEEEKRQKAREAEQEDGIVCSEPFAEILTPMQEWEASLMSCTSYAQLFIHLTSLENSIVWSKSLLNTKCRICRRKTDPEKMLLCDGCDRGHHMYCLKPKLKCIPSGDWYCHDCKPKERIRTPKKTQRRVFSSTEEDESEAEVSTLENNASVAEDKSEDDPDEEDELPLRKRKPPPKKKKGAALTALLGKRRCATEATEKIHRVTREIHSGNSSSSGMNNEVVVSSSGRVQRTKTAPKRPSNEHVNGSQARSKRRRAVDDELLEMFNPTVLEDLLNTMMKHKDGWPFDRPITKADAPDYHKIIEKPMDLGTIRSGINRMKYRCNQEVIEDIKLVFANCWTYNRSDAEEYQCGVRLEKFFFKEAKNLGLIEGRGEPLMQREGKKKHRGTM